jgi:hypothetical protein
MIQTTSEMCPCEDRSTMIESNAIAPDTDHEAHNEHKPNKLYNVGNVVSSHHLRIIGFPLAGVWQHR